jgi:SAD/SRA domain
MKAKYNRSDLTTMTNINTLVNRCQKTAERYGKADPRDFASIRKRLHQMEFYDFLSPIIVKKSKVLDDDTGLPQIFYDPKGVGFPWDIKVDALSLYLRWLKGVLDPHLLRGIDTERKGTASKHTGHKLSKDYLGTVSCNVWGENNLQNGQWWPLQICAKRDGGHGEIEGGIHGQVGKGAFSVVLSNGEYDDRDEGDRILYCGTSGSGGEPSAGTSRLLETYRSYQSGSPHPVRVIRTAKLPKDNPYRPAKGLRYDGLYDVISYEVLHAETAMHRFELRRRAGQDPIRYIGVEARPTDEEIAEFAKIRGLLGMT